MSKKIIVGTDGKHFTLSTGEQSIYIKNIIFNMQEGKAHIEFNDIPIENIELSKNIDKNNKDLQEVIANEVQLQATIDFLSLHGRERKLHNF